LIMVWRNSIAFELSEEENFACETAQNFAQKEIAPLAAKIDRDHYFPRELIPKMGDLGLMGAIVPQEYGGAGLSTLAYALIIEELSAACASTGIIVSAHTSLCIAPILEFGTPEQKQNFLPRLASGEPLGCFALSEQGTGSDAASITTTCRKEGGEFVVNGTKNWITNAPEAGVCILFATQDTAKGNKGICAFVHDMSLPGISLGKHEDKMGIRGSPTSSITYNNVRMPKGSLLHEESRGFAVAMYTLNGGRIGVASQAVGIARSALDDALSYSRERKTFGKQICEHQSIQNYIADMVCHIDSSRYLTLDAAKRKDTGVSYARQAAMAKLFASETAMMCAVKGIQIHGGYGYVTDYPAERHLRDAKITEIYEGTSEIQRILIATQLLKE
jgi:butyryl-CoA dehydrogenase